MGFQNGGGGLRIFLHSAQFFLSVLTIIGLHVTGSLWDYELTRKLKASDFSSGSSARQHPPPPHSGSSSIEIVEPTRYFSGALWAVVIGLLGIAALVVFVLSWVLRLPKTLMTIYYLACACIVIIVSSVGLGWNPGVAAYDACMEKQALEIKRLGHTESGRSSGAHCSRTATMILPQFIVYLISCAHAAVYLASFYVSFTDKTSCPYQSLGMNPAQPVMTPNPEYNQLSAQNSEMQDPDPTPA